MNRFYRIMSPVHNIIIVCGFLAAVGFGMLVAFNKRVAEERQIGTIVTFGEEMTLSQLTNIQMGGL